jgi:uncharacterized protein
MTTRLSAPRDLLDRIAMRQRWHDLLFLHWQIDPNAIQRLLPAGLEVDLYEGRTYVGLVPFRMTGVCPSWFAPVPGISDMLECNVRTYVRPAGGGAKGVWFFSLDAGNAVAVAAARACYALPYFFAKMRQTEERSVDTAGRWRRRVHYTTDRVYPSAPPAGCRVVYEPTGGVAPAAVGSIEEFLLERYVLYAYRGKRLLAARVHHDPYQISPALLHYLQETLISAAGIARPDDPPLVHYSRSIVTEASGLVRVRSDI